MEINNMRDIATRCHRVIKSCQSLDQLTVAENYVNLFWRRATYLCDQYGIDLGVGGKIVLEDALLNKEFDLLEKL
jgi:hypothetical protein